MKLLRYGPIGQEKPGVLDAQGRVRDLSGVVTDIAGATLLPASLTQLRQLKLEDLPLVSGLPQRDLRLGACQGECAESRGSVCGVRVAWGVCGGLGGRNVVARVRR